MTLVLAPVGSHTAGVSMAPIVFDIKAGLMEALEHVSTVKPKAAPRKRAPRKAQGTNA